METTRRTLLSGTAAASVAAVVAAQAGAAAQTAVAPAAAQPAWLIANMPGRKKTALDGLWKYIIDPYDVARRKPRNRRTVWLDEPEDVLNGPLIEYEWDSSPDIRIPGDWNSRVPELSFYDGVTYFRRRFTASSVPGSRRFLVFEAVNYRATVWLNGKEVGAHEGGFTPFVIEVGAALKDGDNVLVVRADSRHGPETLPASDFDWQNYGGITRSVWLVETPATFARDWYVRLENGRIIADLTLDGPNKANATVRLAIPDLRLAAEARTDADGRVRISFAQPRGLKLWSPESPTLYDMEFRAGEDVQVEKIGFRTISTRGREILLNGKPVFLRGIAAHEEAIGAKASRSVSKAEAQALLQQAKDLGCNFIRLAHYPHNDWMARLADSMGLMVWAEIPVYWEDVTYSSPKTLALAKSMMGELVTRDRSRASVVMWSVANETPQTEARTAFLKAVIDHTRALDATRLVTAALDKNVDIGGVKEGESRIMVKDALGAHLDVIAMNQYEAWYSRRRPNQLTEVSFGTPYDKPLVCSEFGADALYGHRGPREERWTEDYQAWLFEETLKRLDETPGLVGTIPWLLKDFRSPRRWHGRFQANWNRKGVISEDGRRKLAFETLRSFYAKKAQGG